MAVATVDDGATFARSRHPTPKQASDVNRVTRKHDKTSQTPKQTLTDGATIDERGEHSEPVPECRSDRRHADDKVNAGPHPRDVLREDVDLGGRNPLPLAVNPELVGGRP